MAASSFVCFVSAGMDKPKKRDNVLSRRQQYLNYGALTLATILDSKGYDVRLYHGGHSDPELFAKKLYQEGALNSIYPLMLSMQSLYALSWTSTFTKTIKSLSPSKMIVLGGRWVVGENSSWLRKMLPMVDKIVGGLAENKIVQLVEGDDISSNLAEQFSAVSFGLNHELVDNYKEFQPNVEASRGCGRGCSFCEERNIPLTRLKEPLLLASQLQDLAVQYNDYSITPYVQSSFFAPNTRWSEKLFEAVSRYEKKIFWRCETRVDTINPSSISALAGAGLRVIDLGLESASPSQIISMGKSDKPDDYLRRASDLIKACRDSGVWVKVNFLIYAGETEKTYQETINWLDEHSDCIKGISVGPVVVFGSPSASRDYVSSIVRAGGILVDPVALNSTGVGHIHPSAGISSKEAEELSLNASRRYMTKDDYFDLKSFSYYPRSYTYEDFSRDVEVNGINNLPFAF